MAEQYSGQREHKDALAFVMSFVADSDKKIRRPYVEKQRECLQNFMVEPFRSTGSFTDPYRRQYSYRQTRDNILLKDPETHRTVMVYASKLLRTLFGDKRGEYIKARPVGWEDAPQKAPTVTKLLRYDLALPGVFRTFVESVVDMLLVGTSVIEIGWEKRERELPVREVGQDQFGDLPDQVTRQMVPIYDDPTIRVVDYDCFYPDPGRYRMQDMSGCAKKFTMNKLEARAKAEGRIFRSDKVEAAIKAGPSAASRDREDRVRDVGDSFPEDATQLSDFTDMIGYEYWGDFCYPLKDDNGVQSTGGVITVLNGEVVQIKAWPLGDPCLPFYTMIINPMQGRFYGISPAEVIRFDQEYADAIKVLLATAVIRQVHPPIAYEPDSEIDVGKLKAWRADTPIAVRGGPAAVGTLQYRADIGAGFAMLTGIKNNMGEASGAVGGLGGEEGPDREAASVGVQRVQMALDRPELATMVLEKECLPPIAKALLRRNQQFLDTEGLLLRVGEQPDPIWIGDIMGDFDVEFVGSRIAMSREQKLQAYDRLISMVTAAPAFAAGIPWDQLGPEIIGDVLELPEVAAKMGDPQTLMRNILLQQAMGQGGAGQNGVAQGSEPAGMGSAQAGGGLLSP